MKFLFMVFGTIVFLLYLKRLFIFYGSVAGDLLGLEVVLEIT
jgi:hypothetical protein